MKLFKLPIAIVCSAILLTSCDFKAKMNELLSPKESTEEFRADFKTLVELGAVGGNFKPGSMRDDYIATAKKGLTTKEAEAKVDEYLAGQAITDFADVASTYYDSFFTDNDIDYLAEQFGSDEGKSAVANSAKVYNAIGAFVNQALTGKSIPRIATKECPEEYEKKFVEYYRIANADSILNSMISQFETVAKLSKNSPIDEKTWPFYKNLAKGLFPQIMLNETYGIMTMEDMDFYIATLSSESGKKLKQGDLEMLNDAIKVRLKLNQKFSAWMSQSSK
jgi:hypothetical protein